MTGVKQVALVEQPEAPSLPTVSAPPASDLVLMFERLAKDPAVDVAKLERLIEMQERILRHAAKSAFDAAFAELQGDIPAIVERGKTNNGTYARLEDIVETVRPILRQHGFSLSHTTEWPDAKTVKIVGVLTHRAGHEKRSEFLSGADSSGNKNAIQGLGSALSYGRRYTTKDLLNIVTRDEDDDGGKAGRKAEAEPDGYEAWIGDLDAVAIEGTAALQAAWAESPKRFQAHLTKTDPKKWEAIKKVAAMKGAGK